MSRQYGRHQAMSGKRTGSWHIVEEVMQYRGGPGFATLCGRWMLGIVAPEHPWAEKTCETCFRLAARAEDR